MSDAGRSKKRKNRSDSLSTANKAILAATDDYPELKRDAERESMQKKRKAREQIQYSSSDDDSDENPVSDTNGEGDGATEESPRAKSGMADAMAKILRKQITSDPVLSKAKTIQEDEDDGAAQKAREERLAQKARDNAAHQTDVSHSTSLVFETKLRKIATRGAVVLFNAVRKQQKATVETENAASATAKKKLTAAGGASDRKGFIDMLKKSAAAKAAKSADGKKNAGKDVASDASLSDGWRVLQDGYMTKGKHKDWEDGDGDAGTAEQLADDIGITPGGDSDSSDEDA
eukprot:m.32167 g.32167  ORF g.32167 m.32167 type:complete len:289 (-) comp14090_c0_seq4:258-1124(-)